jgi:AcrR family transcriptional regulator
MALADRRSERRTLLLDAALDVLGTQGWDALTVRSVVERARLNPRYFYESFDDLDALAVAVYDRVVTELAGVVRAALSGRETDPAAQVRTVVEAIVGFVDEDRRRGRVLYVEGLGSEGLHRRRIEAGHEVVAFVERYAAGGQRREDCLGRVGAAIVVGGFGQLLVDWLAGRIPVGQERLVDEATELLLSLGQAGATIAARRRRS